MANVTTKNLQDALETLIDATSVTSVLEAIATVCALKADHIRASWQDNQTARVWDRTSQQIDRLADSQVI